MQPGLLGAISPQEQRGLLEPYERQPNPMAGLLGPPVAQRMAEASQAQRARWVAGERSPTPLTEDNMWLADDVAGSFVGPLGMAGIFAGVGAKTADKAALRVAKAAAREGKDPRSIWHDTGWFQGPDGKWRWEIDDSRARYKPDFEGSTVRDAMEHGPLFEAYPDMAGMRAERVTPPDRFDGARAYEGTYSPESGIGIHDILGTKTGRSTMLHELQHAVQGREGLARGGAPSAMTPDAARLSELSQQQYLLETAADFARYVDNAGGNVEVAARQFGEWTNPRLLAEAQDAWQKLGRPKFRDVVAGFDELKAAKQVASDPYEQYRRLAGEAEARAVQARRDMTPEQRRATYPLDSFDVPQDELIVRGGLLGDGPQMSVEPDLPEQIAGLLREGRAAEVTDDMLGLLNPNQNRRLVELYEAGATGQPMPMDEASRMARAREMGLGADAYHGTTSDVPAFTRTDGGNMWGNYPYVTSSPDDAAAYATGWHNRITPAGNADPNVIPARIPDRGMFDMDAPMSKRAMRKITDPLDTADGYYRQIINDRMGPRTGQGLWQTLHFNEPEAVSEIVRRHGYRGVTEAADGMAGTPGTQTTMIFDPANIRSRFARFDPRLSHLANLSAAGAGVATAGALASQPEGHWDQAREYLRQHGFLE